MHHPVRRRKRRSHGLTSSTNFGGIGVRMVEVERGNNGFGFTISGQQPCLLSCIVAGSPAEFSGLRPGHALVAVNGCPVAKLPHDNVVRLIGNCTGTLRLHVTESYYPMSSDSEFEDVDSYLPRRPPTGHTRTANNRLVRGGNATAMYVIEKQQLQLQQQQQQQQQRTPPLKLPPRGAQNLPPPPPPSRIQPNDFKAVVGYLGTIELPKVLHPGSKLAVIRSCVKRMRAEKRIHTTVMLIVRKNESVILADSLGTILAKFPAERVAFCGACAEDKSFFGLVTSVPSLDNEDDEEEDEDDLSAACGGSSCHVFMVDSTMHLHKAHNQRAAAFRIVCTSSGDGGCNEFPSHADPILRAVAALYNPPVASPPPRSNTSHSSNSDSGIGFKEEENGVLQQPLLPPIAQQQQPIQSQNSTQHPKVYSAAAQSLEDIGPINVPPPSGDEMSMSSLEQPSWGSLQDVRSLHSRGIQRRRKHTTTHHQHPIDMPPPSLNVTRSLPSQTPQNSDDEDYAVPFKKWCGGSYLTNNQTPPSDILIPRKLNLSNITLLLDTSNSPMLPILQCQRLLEQNITLSTSLSPITDEDKLLLLAVDNNNDSIIYNSPVISIISKNKNNYIETNLDENLTPYRENNSDESLTPYREKNLDESIANTTTNTDIESDLDSTVIENSYLDLSVTALMNNVKMLSDTNDTSVSFDDDLSCIDLLKDESSSSSSIIQNISVISNNKNTNELEYNKLGSTTLQLAYDIVTMEQLTEKCENVIKNEKSIIKENFIMEEEDDDMKENEISVVKPLKSNINFAKIIPLMKLSPDSPCYTLENKPLEPSKTNIKIPKNIELPGLIHSPILNLSSNNKIKLAKTIQLPGLINSETDNDESLMEFSPKYDRLKSPKRKFGTPDRMITPAKKRLLTPKIKRSNILKAVENMFQIGQETPHLFEIKSILRKKPEIKKDNVDEMNESYGIHKKVTFNLLDNDEFMYIDDDVDDMDQNQSKDGKRVLSARSTSEGGDHCTDNKSSGNNGPNTFDSFERLLDEPNGLHAFAEFLKKEFSHENIYFWVACEKYRRLKDENTRKQQAKLIYQRHLGPGASEPVNVDSQARQTACEGIEKASPDLFITAQKQIFNLMKFDSYPRYLKSEGKDDCSAEKDPDLLLHSPDEPNPGKLKKSRSDADERRRKSLLPWSRGKNTQTATRTRSKSRDRAGECGGEIDSASLKSELTGSRSSLASSDLALIQRGSSSRQSLSSVENSSEFCRICFPDGATTVLSIPRGENIKSLISKLIEKRGLNYGSFEVFIGNDSKPLVLSDDALTLSGQEVRLEQRIVFRLDLPSRKTVGVKAKAGRTLAEVLKPILNKYGYRLDNTVVTLICDSQPLSPLLSINAVENQRLQVNVTGPDGWQHKGTSSNSSGGKSLDEITNKVFKEVLQEKTEKQETLSDQGSVRSEDWSSEHSSGIFGRFLRRDSAFLDKTRESRMKAKKEIQAVKHASLELDSKINGLNKAKWKLRPQSNVRSESDELYEGLKRAQRRMDDQRGTEINFELPDFLKDKENSSQDPRMKKGRLTEGDSILLGANDGVDLSPAHDTYYSLCNSASGNNTNMDPPAPPQRHINDPPPLPPKPKILPLRSSKWNPSEPMNNNNEIEQQSEQTPSTTTTTTNTSTVIHSTTSFV